MKAPTERRPIAKHQLCAIARLVLLPDPTITDSDWKAETKELAAKQGYAEPTPEMLAQALSNVEAALAQTLGPRPLRLERPRPDPINRAIQMDPPWKRPHPGWWVVAQMISALVDLKTSAPASVEPRRAAVYDLSVTEDQALHEFWTTVATGADRIEVLQVFAEVAIVRPAGWDYAAIRAGKTDSSVCLSASECFGCGSDRQRAWHHVIQIQFGGSNTARNRVMLCDYCHAAVHPWLGATPSSPEACGAFPLPRRAEGFFSLADILVAAPTPAKRERA